MPASQLRPQIPLRRGQAATQSIHRESGTGDNEYIGTGLSEAFGEIGVQHSRCVPLC